MRVEPVLVGVLPDVEPLEHRVGLIEDVDADFLADHVLLVLEVLFADVERAHSIGLQPERSLHTIARKRLVVVREIETGRAIQVPAVRLDDLGVLHLLHVRRALKHHVLEEVSEPGAPFRLDAEANSVIHGHGDGRRGVTLADYDLQAIR